MDTAWPLPHHSRRDVEDGGRSRSGWWRFCLAGLRDGPAHAAADGNGGRRGRRGRDGRAHWSGHRRQVGDRAALGGVRRGHRQPDRLAPGGEAGIDGIRGAGPTPGRRRPGEPAPERRPHEGRAHQHHRLARPPCGSIPRIPPHREAKGPHPAPSATESRAQPRHRNLPPIPSPPPTPPPSSGSDSSVASSIAPSRIEARPARLVPQVRRHRVPVERRVRR